MQQAIEQLLPATGYCIETRAIALSNGYFPGFLLERTFIGKHVVDGVTFLEFQNATGARHVIDASTIERIIPLGRMARLGDALRTAKVPTLITIAFEFLDTTRGQGASSAAALGLPDCWMDALIGDGYIEQRDYIAPGILRRIVARFPTQHHLDQFASSVRGVSKLLGTYAFRASNGISIADFLRN